MSRSKSTGAESSGAGALPGGSLPAGIIEFWFSSRLRPLWFASTPALDEEIRARFEVVWQRAGGGAYEAWRETSTGCLALILVFDQFPLNMYRGDARSFSTESQALKTARHGLNHRFHRALTEDQQVFFYMPFMHSEDMADQDLSVELFRALGRPENLRFAEHHRGIVARFGRFPHRNAILGRESSAEERAYLASPEAFTG